MSVSKFYSKGDKVKYNNQIVEIVEHFGGGQYEIRFNNGETKYPISGEEIEDYY